VISNLCEVQIELTYCLISGSSYCELHTTQVFLSTAEGAFKTALKSNGLIDFNENFKVV
jgi:hypothetical protein